MVVVMMENRSFDPTWARCRSMIVVTYDEHGGFYDHVPPPTVEDERAADGFGQLGFRVPSLVISPYTRRGNVSSMLHERASVPAFLGWLFGLEPLTVRDANANILLDTFDVDRVRRPNPRAAPALPVLQVDPEPVLECLELWVGEAAGQVELASFAERAGLAHLDRRARNWERLANVRRTLVELGGAVVRR
ncbi:MAG: alkaline phosphatase family protein [Thermodesulfobacteriota bacterium]